MRSPLLLSFPSASLGAVAVSAAALVLTGCGAGIAAPNSAEPAAYVSGTAMGGHQPVIGAAIRLYAATTAGYGGTPTLLGNATSDANGNFTITPNGNSCADPDQVYITATGGNPGSGTNTAAVLVDALGTCSSVTSSTKVIVNEETTIAAAYALAGFAAVDGSSTAIGTSTTNKAGLTAAFANAANLSTPNGFARSTTIKGNGVVPQALINTLANALAACVNSTGSTSAGCSNVLVAGPLGVTPTNTWQLALSWALYPGFNSAKVFANPTAFTNFYTPTLSNTPNDMSVAIAYTAGFAADGVTPVSAPASLAIDAGQNIWLSGMSGTSTSGTVYSNLVELGPDGSLESPAGGVGSTALKASTGIGGITIDTASSPHVWVASNDGNVYGYNMSSGATTAVPISTTISVAATPTTVSNAVTTVAADSNGDIFYGTGGSASSTTNVLGEVLNASGTYSQQTTFTTTPVFSSAQGTVLTANYGSTYLSVNPSSATSNASLVLSSVGGRTAEYDWVSPYATSPVATTFSTYTAGGGQAFDSAGNIYSVGIGQNLTGSGSAPSGNGRICKNATVATATNCTQLTATSVFAGVAPTASSIQFLGLAQDGLGKLFITTFPNPLSSNTASSATQVASVMEYNPATSIFYTSGTTATTIDGYAPVNTTGTPITTGDSLKNLLIDQTGAIWVANSTAGSTYAVYQILGPASPTVQPLIAGPGTRP